MVIEPSSPDRRRRAICAFLAGALTMAAAPSEKFEFRNDAMERRPQIASNASAFGSRQEAEDFIAAALPRATAANPSYLTKSEGAETRWLTKSVRFEDTPSGIRVSMDEGFTKSVAGVSTVGTHQAVFSLADVDISVSTEPGDVTPSGDPAILLLFKCVAPKCVAATWNGRAVPSDSTDVSIQDEALLSSLLAAFHFLKGGAKTAG